MIPEKAASYFHLWQAYANAGAALEVIDKVEEDDFAELESLCDEAIRRLQEVKKHIKNGSTN